MRVVESATGKKAAAAPAAKKPATRYSATASAGSAKITDPRREFGNEEWQDMVATAAYYRAEARGFEGRSADEDWYEAEAEMRERFAATDSQVETVSTNPGGEAADIETKGE